MFKGFAALFGGLPARDDLMSNLLLSVGLGTAAGGAFLFWKQEERRRELTKLARKAEDTRPFFANLVSKPATISVPFMGTDLSSACMTRFTTETRARYSHVIATALARGAHIDTGMTCADYHKRLRGECPIRDMLPRDVDEATLLSVEMAVGWAEPRLDTSIALSHAASIDVNTANVMSVFLLNEDRRLNVRNLTVDFTATQFAFLALVDLLIKCHYCETTHGSLSDAEWDMFFDEVIDVARIDVATLAALFAPFRFEAAPKDASAQTFLVYGLKERLVQCLKGRENGLRALENYLRRRGALKLDNDALCVNGAFKRRVSSWRGMTVYELDTNLDCTKQ